MQKQLDDSLNISDSSLSSINTLIKTMEKDKSLSSIVPIFHHITNGKKKNIYIYIYIYTFNCNHIFKHDY